MEELNPLFETVSRYFSLLADPSRLKVIHAVCNDERSVSDVMAATGLSQSAASRHLSSLHDAGVASRRKDGALALYKMCDETLIEICRTACVNLLAREAETARSRAKTKKQAERFMASN
jgi:DNA-binding transcriptional ArsR family regulator